MLTTDFDYELPTSSIAQTPVARGQARLLVVDAPPARRHQQVSALPDFLNPGDLLVVNDTRVIPARLFAERPLGGRIEILLVQKRGQRWSALLKPGRRAKPGTILTFTDTDLRAEVLAVQPDGTFLLSFSRPVEPELERLGHVPLPPYIQRADHPADRERYQTVYARKPGAIAAPTAGLHFTTEMLGQLARRGIDSVAITLHVGLGTFKPIVAEQIAAHHMHGERFSISARAAAKIRACQNRGGRVVAVGTTVVRALETAAQRSGEVQPGAGTSELFITPGFAFHVVDLLFTNFHLPRSTLLVLVAAFAGRTRILDAYREAVRCGYRFYSYGDAMLVHRQRG